MDYSKKRPRRESVPPAKFPPVSPQSAKFEKLAETGDTVAKTGKPVWEPMLVWRSFPVDVLPEPLHSFVITAAKAIGCDASYIALPLLTALAAAIGNSRIVLLKKGWCEPSILWTAIVGDSGSMKTPAFKLAMKALRDRQGKALGKQAKAMKGYQEDFANHEKTMAAWKRDRKTKEPPPEPPEPPCAERSIVTDTTVEALAPILLDNPRGLLLSSDELSGWFGSFDRYSGGKGGGDSAHWLSMHGAESLLVDRKTGIPRTIHVPLASVSVTGGIQPSILRRALGSEHRESGLAARILLAYPPRTPKRWTESGIDSKAQKEVSRLFERLYELNMIAGEDEGSVRPAVVGLASEAKREWIAFYDRHAKEQAKLAGDLAAAWSKLEAYAARLALVIHCCRWAYGGGTPGDLAPVDAESMAAGIRLVEWFKVEARRVYAMLAESEESSEREELVEWIRRKGGSVTARELSRGPRQYRNAGDADAVLCQLVEAKLGEWAVNQTAGRQRREFVLLSATGGDGDTSPSNRKKNDLPSPSPVSPASETQIYDDWGEL